MRGGDMNMYEDMAKVCGNRVWCTKCGATQKVDAAECLRYGWPKCCGYTMTIDSPKKRKALAEIALEQA